MKLKQIKLKEFMNIAKNKPKESSNEEEKNVDAAFNDLARDPENKSRAATVRQTFNLNCHLKEYIYMAIKEYDKNG